MALADITVLTSEFFFLNLPPFEIESFKNNGKIL